MKEGKINQLAVEQYGKVGWLKGAGEWKRNWMKQESQELLAAVLIIE